MYEYNAIVRSIYDADTIRVDCDLGFNIWSRNEPLRLYGIDAPELRGETLMEARKSRDWLIQQIPIGTKIVIKTYRDRKEKYGRYLATIYVNGRNLNEELVANGFAVPYIP
jgi:micrococcal nuclease